MASGPSNDDDDFRDEDRKFSSLFGGGCSVHLAQTDQDPVRTMMQQRKEEKLGRSPGGGNPIIDAKDDV